MLPKNIDLVRHSQLCKGVYIWYRIKFFNRRVTRSCAEFSNSNLWFCATPRNFAVKKDYQNI